MRHYVIQYIDRNMNLGVFHLTAWTEVGALTRFQKLFVPGYISKIFCITEWLTP